MKQLELRSVHPVEVKEITPWSGWVFSRAVIAAVFILSFAPFVAYYVAN